MRSLASLSAWRLVALLVLAPLAFLSSACDNQNGGPEVDLSGLSERLQDKIRTLRENVTSSPEDIDPVGELGAIYFVHGFPEAAAACFTRAKNLSPQTKHWWYYTGLSCDEAGQREQALAAYERGLEPPSRRSEPHQPRSMGPQDSTVYPASPMAVLNCSGPTSPAS